MNVDYRFLIFKIVEQVDERYLSTIYHFVKQFIKKDQDN